MTQPHWKMAVDVSRCIGCHACSVACKVEHDVPLGSFRTKVYYYDAGTFPKVKRHFLPTLCMQCEDAPCLKACPTKAIRRDPDGPESRYSQFVNRVVKARAELGSKLVTFDVRLSNTAGRSDEWFAPTP